MKPPKSPILKTECESCHKPKPTRSAYIQGIYYRNICDSCIGISESDDALSSGGAGYDRRRGYEDNAQDTIQPFDANGPNAEFARLYPRQAEKVFDKKTLDKLKRKI